MTHKPTPPPSHYLSTSSTQSLQALDYKIPYQLSQTSNIVEHLEQSQQQLQFLKYKLSEAFAKLEKQIRANMDLADRNEKLEGRVSELEARLRVEGLENRKLRELVENMVSNRRIADQELEYTHKRYKKMIADKQQQYQQHIQQLDKTIKKLKRQNSSLQDFLQKKHPKHSPHKEKSHTTQKQQNKQHQRILQSKIQILEEEIKKLTSEKVTEVTRLKHEIQCYQRSSLVAGSSVSPVRVSCGDQSMGGGNARCITSRPVQIQYFDAQSQSCYNYPNGINNQNVNVNVLHNYNRATRMSCDKYSDKPINSINSNNLSGSTIIQSKLTVDSTKPQQQSISKWQKSKVSSQMTDDQKLTRAQMEKKKLENQLIRIERLKRHGPEDRVAMENLERKMYELDSEISALKRKIRQRY